MIVIEPKDVISLPTIKELIELRDSMNLTDRQKEIFFLKYSRGFRNIDIANELNPPVCQDTVSEELKIIREKLSAIGRENIDKKNNI